MTTITKIELINQSEAQYVASLSKEKFYELFPRKEKTVKGSGEKELNNNEYYKLVIQYLAQQECVSAGWCRPLSVTQPNLSTKRQPSFMSISRS
jgi:hypothetical protein